MVLCVLLQRLYLLVNWLCQQGKWILLKVLKLKCETKESITNGEQQRYAIFVKFLCVFTEILNLALSKTSLYETIWRKCLLSSRPIRSKPKTSCVFPRFSAALLFYVEFLRFFPCTYSYFEFLRFSRATFSYVEFLRFSPSTYSYIGFPRFSPAALSHVEFPLFLPVSFSCVEFPRFSLATFSYHEFW